jgi:hypothetical protein
MYGRKCACVLIALYLTQCLFSPFSSQCAYVLIGLYLTQSLFSPFSFQYVSRKAAITNAQITKRTYNGCSIFVAVVVTSAPGNEAELQLYRVMQRASLLAYYDTLLEMGRLIVSLFPASYY